MNELLYGMTKTTTSLTFTKKLRELERETSKVLIDQNQIRLFLANRPAQSEINLTFGNETD